MLSRSFLLLGCLLALTPPAPLMARDYELTDAQRARLRQLLPRTSVKLERREPVHVVALGDSISNIHTLDDNANDWVRAFHSIFLEKLTEQFFYTGGVRHIHVPKGREDKRIQLAGPEITIENMALSGSNSFAGSARLSTIALANNPDLVLVEYGINDANFAVPHQQYIKTITRLVDTIRARGSDCILLGPTLCAAEPAVEYLGLARPYASALHDLAAERGVLYVDLGNPGLFAASLSPEDNPEDLLPRILRSLDRDAYLFDNGEIDRLHFNLEGHRRFGHAIFRELLAPSEPELRISDGQITPRADGGLSLQATLMNPGSEPVLCHLAPLGIGRELVAQDKAFSCEIPAGGTLPLALSYAPKAGASTPPLLPSGEPLVRVPLLASTLKGTSILVVKAARTPIGMVWRSGITTNQSGQVVLEATITNNSAQPFSGSYTTSWKGQTAKGQVELAPGASQPITIAIAVPTEPTVHSSRGILQVDFGNNLAFHRELELSRNLGLQEWRPLIGHANYSLDDPEHQSSAPSAPGVQFRVDADAQALFLSYDVKGINLAAKEGEVAARLDIMIDARSYRDWSKPDPGGLRELRIRFPSTADGKGTVGRIPEGVFGDGYAAELSNTGITADLSTRPNGNRRITIAIPQKYFYLHIYGGSRVAEALGNRNVQFGINTSLALLNPDPENLDRYPFNRRFSIVQNLTPINDIEGLSTLEFGNPNTGRWSARLF